MNYNLPNTAVEKIMLTCFKCIYITGEVQQWTQDRCPDLSIHTECLTNPTTGESSQINNSLNFWTSVFIFTATLQITHRDASAVQQTWWQECTVVKGTLTFTSQGKQSHIILSRSKDLYSFTSLEKQTILYTTVVQTPCRTYKQSWECDL